MRLSGICFGLIVAAAMTMTAPSASAGVVFDMTGTCLSFCGSTGQNSGDPISGFVEFDNFDAAANGTQLVPDSYYLEFGNVVLDSTTPNADYFLHDGLDALTKIDAADIGPGTFRVWSATENIAMIFVGNCYGCDAHHWAYGFAPGSYGTFQFTRTTPLPTPEPASTVPFAAGIAFLGFAFLRQRRKR